MNRSDKLLFGVSAFTSGFSFAVSIYSVFQNNSAAVFIYLMLAWIYGFIAYKIAGR